MTTLYGIYTGSVKRVKDIGYFLRLPFLKIFKLTSFSLAASSFSRLVFGFTTGLLLEELLLLLVVAAISIFCSKSSSMSGDCLFSSFIFGLKSGILVSVAWSRVGSMCEPFVFEGTVAWSGVGLVVASCSFSVVTSFSARVAR